MFAEKSRFIIAFSVLFITMGILFVMLNLPSVTDPDKKTYTVLFGSWAETMLDQCSRHTPAYEGSWTPTEQQISKLEKDLPNLNKLNAVNCCGKGKIIGKASEYKRQYVGIISKSKKTIYINAYPSNWSLFESKEAIAGYPVSMCDGGKNYWGAVYNPKTRSFSELAFNGEG